MSFHAQRVLEAKIAVQSATQAIRDLNGVEPGEKTARALEALLALHTGGVKSEPR